VHCVHAMPNNDDDDDDDDDNNNNNNNNNQCPLYSAEESEDAEALVAVL